MTMILAQALPAPDSGYTEQIWHFAPLRETSMACFECPAPRRVTDDREREVEG
jgi:hypothetical protein